MSPDRFPTRTPVMPSKPYDRADSPTTADNLLGQDTEDQPSFPTYAQYKAIEASYIDSLSPKRQFKALISQALFDRIWDVLTKPKDCNETAQFRFWVRKMFQLGSLDEVDIDLDYYIFDDPPQRDLILHDGLLVAVQEKLYSLLCHFHGKVNHGGRDKTCSSVRQHYAWVPKDLIAQFVKSCPTCKCKRRGRLDMIPMARLLRSKRPLGTPSKPLFPVLGDSSFKQEDVSVTSDWQYSGFPMPVENTQASTGLGLQSLSMSREVSLYQGLPNGWQFYSDYATARMACLEMKKLRSRYLGRHEDSFPGRPRVPSIAPMIPPNMQELMDTYLLASPQQERSHKYVDPTLLSLPLPEGAKIVQDVGGASAPPKLDLDLAYDDDGSFHTMYALGDFSPSATSLTPELIESGLCMDNDSPSVTELSTPQDESVNELGGNLLFSGLKYGLTCEREYPMNNIPH